MRRLDSFQGGLVIYFINVQTNGGNGKGIKGSNHVLCSKLVSNLKERKALVMFSTQY